MDMMIVQNNALVATLISNGCLTCSCGVFLSNSTCMYFSIDIRPLWPLVDNFAGVLDQQDNCILKC